MELINWPEGLLILVLNHVYFPWRLEIRDVEQQAGDVKVNGHFPRDEVRSEVVVKPMLPPMAALFVCKRFHRLAKTVLFTNFDGVLDVRADAFQPFMCCKWTSLHAWITAVWLWNGRLIMQRELLCRLPALQNIEIFNTDWKLAVVKPTANLLQKPRFKTLRLASKDLVREFESRWGKRVRVLVHVICYDGEKVSFSDEYFESRPNVTLRRLLCEGVPVFDLVYEVCGPNGGGGYELSSSQSWTGMKM